MSTKKVSRREMLISMGISAAGTAAVLSGCAPATQSPTSTPVPSGESGPTPTPVASENLLAGDTVSTMEEGQKAYGTYEEWHPTSPVEITAWAPTGPDTDPWIMSIKAQIARFSSRYPEIKINYEPINWDDTDTKVAAAKTSNQGPDIIWEFDREAQFARDGVIKPFPEGVISADYIKAHKFYEVRPLKDGLLYWLHAGVMGPILYCNKSLLAERGLKPADAPKTWDEFGKFCQQLTKVEGGQMTQAGFAFNKYARFIWNDMVYQQGAHCYDSKTAYFDSPESINAWQMLVDFYDKYKINDRAFLQYDEAFGTGKAAFTQVWTWFGGSLAGNYPDLDWAPVTYPTFTGKGPYGRMDYDGHGWMVTTFAQGEKEKAAWEFVKFNYHTYQDMVDHTHANGMVLVTTPHPDYSEIFENIAQIDKPTQAERRMQSLAVLSMQLDGGMVFPGEVAGPFQDMWQKMEEAILYNKEPIKATVAEYKKLYEQMLGQTNFWVTPEA